MFSARPYDREFLERANTALSGHHELTFFETRLTAVSVALAAEYDAVCAFVNDLSGATC